MEKGGKLEVTGGRKRGEVQMRLEVRIGADEMVNGGDVI